MEKVHNSNNTSNGKDAYARNGRRLRITYRTIEKSKEVMASVIAEAKAAPQRRTMTAETVVQENLEGINYLRAQGYSLERIYEVFVKRIKLGISPATFARYVRRASGSASGAVPEPALPAQVVEPAPVVSAGWNCDKCQSSAVPEKYQDKTIWVCPACDIVYASGADGKISSTRFSG